MSPHHFLQAPSRSGKPHVVLTFRHKTLLAKKWRPLGLDFSRQKKSNTCRLALLVGCRRGRLPCATHERHPRATFTGRHALRACLDAVNSYFVPTAKIFTTRHTTATCQLAAALAIIRVVERASHALATQLGELRRGACAEDVLIRLARPAPAIPHHSRAPSPCGPDKIHVLFVRG